MIKDKYEGRIREVLHLIEDAASANWDSQTQTFMDAIKIEGLANKVRMSPSSLKQHFKAVMGESIGHYAKHRRITYMTHLYANCPEMTTTAIANRIGLANNQAIYPILQRLGIKHPKDFQLKFTGQTSTIDYIDYENVPAQQILYIAQIGKYDDFSTIEFEEHTWLPLEQFAQEQGWHISDYIGIAIDNIADGDKYSGHFTAGITIDNNEKNINTTIDQLFKLKTIPPSSYRVFKWTGPYDALTSLYDIILSNIHSDPNVRFNPDGIMYEKYLNSPIDTDNNSLETEIWVPITMFKSV